MSQTKIESLTPQQEKELIEWRKQFFNWGVCTDPADRPKAEAAITEMYKVIGENKPHFVWADSPLTANILIHVWPKLRNSLMASLRDSLGDSLRESLGDSLRDSLGDSLRESLGDSLRDSLGDSLRESLGDSLRDRLGDSLRDSLGDSLRDRLGDSLRDSLWDRLRDSLRDSLWDRLRDSLWDRLRDIKIEYTSTYHWGQMDAYWIAFYSFCEKIGVQYDQEKSKHLHLHSDIAQSCGWWWPYKNICFVSERPLHVRMDAQERIHDYDKPCVEFRDGWKIYAIHGSHVPEKYILTPKDQIDPKEVLKETNSEVRMAVIKKCGFEHFKKHLPTQTISQCSSADLLEFDLGEAKVRGLLVKWDDKFEKNKQTIIPVPTTHEQFAGVDKDCIPENINDAEQVRRWTLGLDNKAEFVQET